MENRKVGRISLCTLCFHRFVLLCRRSGLSARWIWMYARVCLCVSEESWHTLEAVARAIRRKHKPTNEVEDIPMPLLPLLLCYCMPVPFFASYTRQVHTIFGWSTIEFFRLQTLTIHSSAVVGMFGHFFHPTRKIPLSFTFRFLCARQHQEMPTESSLSMMNFELTHSVSSNILKQFKRKSRALRAN